MWLAAAMKDGVVLGTLTISPPDPGGDGWIFCSVLYPTPHRPQPCLFAPNFELVSRALPGHHRPGTLPRCGLGKGGG